MKGGASAPKAPPPPPPLDPPLPMIAFINSRKAKVRHIVYNAIQISLVVSEFKILGLLSIIHTMPQGRMRGRGTLVLSQTRRQDAGGQRRSSQLDCR